GIARHHVVLQALAMAALPPPALPGEHAHLAFVEGVAQRSLGSPVVVAHHAALHEQRVNVARIAHLVAAAASAGAEQRRDDAPSLHGPHSCSRGTSRGAPVAGPENTGVTGNTSSASSTSPGQRVLVRGAVVP